MVSRRPRQSCECFVSGCLDSAPVNLEFSRSGRVQVQFLIPLPTVIYERSCVVLDSASNSCLLSTRSAVVSVVVVVERESGDV